MGIHFYYLHFSTWRNTYSGGRLPSPLGWQVDTAASVNTIIQAHQTLESGDWVEPVLHTVCVEEMLQNGLDQHEDGKLIPQLL